MAHFRCAACVARVWRDGGDDERCPGCGGPLEAVTRAEDLIGLRALSTRPRAGQTIADQVRATIARNDAARRERHRVRPHDPPT
jgi:hypothetical protein